MTARAGTREPSSTSIAYGLLAHARRFPPFATISCALLGEQLIHELVRLVRRLDSELHQATRTRIDRRLAQLRRIHLAEAFEPRNGRSGARVVLFDFLEQLGVRLSDRATWFRASASAYGAQSIPPVQPDPPVPVKAGAPPGQ